MNKSFLIQSLRINKISFQFRNFFPEGIFSEKEVIEFLTKNNFFNQPDYESINMINSHLKNLSLYSQKTITDNFNNNQFAIDYIITRIK